MVDFLDIARPYLAQLTDDPQLGPPDVGQGLTTRIFERSLDTDPVIISLPTGGTGVAAPRGLSPADPEGPIAARDAAGEIGIEAFAFYKSFRFADRRPFRGSWGIFLIDSGIGGVAREFLSQRTPPSPAEAVRLAIATLFQHERYHFWVDAWALAVEITTLGSNRKRYEYYLQFSRSENLTPADSEEVLANHYTYQFARKNAFCGVKNSGRLVRNFFKTLPTPYSLFDLSDAEKRLREYLLAGAVANGQCNTTIKGAAALTRVGENFMHIIGRAIKPNWDETPLVPTGLCPLHLVVDADYSSRVKPFQGPPRLELMKFISSYLNGTELPRTKHQKFRIDNGATVTFPNPHETRIRGYEFKNILDCAGMTQKEYHQASDETDGWRKNCPRPSPRPPLKRPDYKR